MPVRIYDISKKLGLENKDIIAKAKALGITSARVASSNLDKITAEFLEEEILKEHPDIAARLMAPPATTVRISEVANKVGLPVDEVRMIAKEFNIASGPTPDSLIEQSANELTLLIQSGTV